MPSKLDEKKEELRIKKLEIELLEEEIAKLSIKERNTIADLFPIHSTVTLIGKTEKTDSDRRKQLSSDTRTALLSSAEKKKSSCVPPRTSY